MRKYKLRHLILDIILTTLTSGFWLIWIFVREMRNNRRNQFTPQTRYRY